MVADCFVRGASMRHLTGLAILLVSTGVFSQQAPPRIDERYPYMAVWLTGELGRGCAGVVVPRKYDEEKLKQTLSNSTEFMFFPPPMFVTVSPTGRMEDAKIGKALQGYQGFSKKIHARQDLFTGGSKVGTQTADVTVTGTLGLVQGGPFGTEESLLPLNAFYGAKGTIVTTDTGAGKQKEVAQITGSVLGLANGKLALGLRASPGDRTYVIADFENVVMHARTVSIYRDDTFGLTRSGSGAATCIAATHSREPLGQEP